MATFQAALLAGLLSAALAQGDAESGRTKADSSVASNATGKLVSGRATAQAKTASLHAWTASSTPTSSSRSRTSAPAAARATSWP